MPLSITGPNCPNSRADPSTVSGPLPVEGYFATMKVRELGENRCEFQWSSTFEPKGASEEEAKKAIEDIYSMGFEGLKKLYGG